MASGIEEISSFRPMFRALAFFISSTDSTAQRFGINRATARHLLVCKAPIRCQSISSGRVEALWRSSGRWLVSGEDGVVGGMC